MVNTEGLNTEVSVNFMSLGHTKFSKNWRFRGQDDVSCLEDINQTMKLKSMPAIQVNIPQLVGHVNNSLTVPTHECKHLHSPIVQLHHNA